MLAVRATSIGLSWSNSGSSSLLSWCCWRCSRGAGCGGRGVRASNFQYVDGMTPQNGYPGGFPDEAIFRWISYAR